MILGNYWCTFKGVEATVIFFFFQKAKNLLPRRINRKSQKLSPLSKMEENPPNVSDLPFCMTLPIYFDTVDKREITLAGKCLLSIPLRKKESFLSL